jgi:hypothetical protein
LEKYNPERFNEDNSTASKRVHLGEILIRLGLLMSAGNLEESLVFSTPIQEGGFKAFKIVNIGWS